ncbi:MAG: flagellin [Proteobacteria bacterium]|nr:flagellin [Pseudomonadota bacterium]
MPISITSNFSSAVARQNLTTASEEANRSISRVSSGLRVFSAKEDASSLAIATNLRVDVAAFRAAQINVTQATSMLQIADGAIGEISNIMERMGFLASTAQSDQVSDVERGFINTEYQQLLSELTRIGETATFNDTPLLGGATRIDLNATTAGLTAAQGFAAYTFDQNKVSNADAFEVSYDSATNLMTVTNTTTGISDSRLVATPAPGFVNEYNFDDIGVKLTLSNAFDDTVTILPATETFDVVANASSGPLNVTFQVGVGTNTNDRITLSLPEINAAALGLGATDLSTKNNADIAAAAIVTAQDQLNLARANIGAYQSRVAFAASNVAVIMENSEAARSTLVDTDVPAEMTNLASNQVLMQAGVAMVAQANQRPEVLLRLLEG